MDALAQATAGIDALAAVDPAELDPAVLGELIVGLHRLGDRLSGVTHRAVAVQGRTAAWQGQGARSHKQWLAQRCRLSPGEAAGKARTAQRLEALPETAEALADGRIGAGHARVAAQAVRDLPPDAAEGLDRLVVEEGGRVDAARLRTAVDDYAHRTAPESLAERERRAWESRRLSVSRTVEGGVALDGRLDVLGGETVLTALAALSAPGGADDGRSGEQRHADALVTLSRQALDQGELPVVGGVRPHVTVVVPLETLQTAGPDTVQAGGAGGAGEAGGDAEGETATGRDAGASAAGAAGGVAAVGPGGQAELGLDATAGSTGPTGAAAGGTAGAAGAAGRGAAGAAGAAATLGQRQRGSAPGVGAGGGPGAGSGGGPARLDRLGTISGEAARMLACDAGIVRVITAGASQPLDVGRETRVVSAAQRRALAVRDGGCIGCRAPTGWCEAHHIRHWLDWGVTDLDNLVLVCSGCHRDIHDRGWTPVCGPDGHWTLHPPDPPDPPQPPGPSGRPARPAGTARPAAGTVQAARSGAVRAERHPRLEPARKPPDYPTLVPT